MRALSLIPLLLVAGCVGRDIDAPSLAPRAEENSPILVPDEAREPQSAADPALVQRLAALEAAAQTGHAAFLRARDRATAAAGRAGSAARGSESWIAAQQELSALDATRGPVAQASGAIDQLRQEPANAGAGNRAAIDAAAARLAILADDEAAAFQALSARLNG